MFSISFGGYSIPFGDSSILYKKPLENSFETKKNHQNIELTFNFKKEIPLIFFLSPFEDSSILHKKFL